ncbi:MAG: DUF3795 domain-containing protein [Anaerolineae bacterium]
MHEANRLLAVCGLQCGECDIRRAGEDATLAQQIATWFRRERGKEVAFQQIRCGGCRGPREAHWSAECWILHCCVDEKGLSSCSECADFPCDRLRVWAAGDEGYSAALARLKRLRGSSHAF